MPERRGTDVAGELVEQVGALVREELRLAVREMLDKARGAGVGGAFVVAAAITVLYAGALALSGFVLLLAKQLPPWLAALVASGVLTGVATVTGLAGVDRMRRALPLLPEQAVADTARRAREARPADVTDLTPER